MPRLEFAWEEVSEQSSAYNELTMMRKCRPWQGGSVAWSAVLCTRGLWVRSPAVAQTEENRLMFLSHIIDVSVSLSLPFSLKINFKKVLLTQWKPQ